MKLRRIAAAVMIVSLGAASFTFAAVRGQMADCRITEKTIVGDAAAAAGLSASFGMGLQISFTGGTSILMAARMTAQTYRRRRSAGKIRFLRTKKPRYRMCGSQAI